MSIKKIILMLFMILLLLLSCSEGKDKPGNTTGKEVVEKKEFDLLVKEVKIKESEVYKGMLLTSSPGDKCFYVEEPTGKMDKTIPLKIISKENGKILKRVVLNKEYFFSKVNFDNPSPLYNPPSYICNLDDRYYIVGRFSKINTFDSDFKLLYSSKFQKPRYFIAFFKEDGKVKFVVGGKKDPKKKWKISISLYTLFKYREIKKNKTIYEIFIPNVFRSYYSEGKMEKTFPGSNILPSLSGFIKWVAPPTHMGKLYYSIGTENQIYIYHLDTGETKVFQLNHLKGKKYTSEDAQNIKKHKLPRGLKKHGEIAPQPFGGKIFHLGLLDAGEDKIGIIGELDTDKMVFRLDIFSAATLDYIESILLPCGTSFLQSLERGPALFPIFIDYDKKTYIWGDWEGKKPDFFVKYSRFGK